MIVKKESDEICFGNLTESYYLTGAENEYRVTMETIGAFDENGDPDIGLYAEISVNEAKYHDPETFGEIEKIISEKITEVEWEKYDETIMVCALDIRSTLYTEVTSSPDMANEIFIDIVNTLAEMEG